MIGIIKLYYYIQIICIKNITWSYNYLHHTIIIVVVIIVISRSSNSSSSSYLKQYNYLKYLKQCHHHHVVPPARISLTLSCHFSLSFIAFGKSSGLHPVSSQSCCVYVRAGRPAFARPQVEVHLTCIVFVMGGRLPYSWCFVGCCLKDLFNIARSILV